LFFCYPKADFVRDQGKLKNELWHCVCHAMVFAMLITKEDEEITQRTTTLWHNHR
jgi:hypothetical protein